MTQREMNKLHKLHKLQKNWVNAVGIQHIWNLDFEIKKTEDDNTGLYTN